MSTKAILFILAYSVQTMRYAHPNLDSKRHATVRLEGFGESSVSPGTISRSECHTLRLWLHTLFGQFIMAPACGRALSEQKPRLQ